MTRNRSDPGVAIGTGARGFAARPNAFGTTVQPVSQVGKPHIGLLAGDTRDPDALAAPSPITGAAGSPVNPIAIK